MLQKGTAKNKDIRLVLFYQNFFNEFWKSIELSPREGSANFETNPVYWGKTFLFFFDYEHFDGESLST